MIESTAPVRQDRALRGALLMMAGMAVMTVMDTIAKLVVEADYHPLQILAIRGWLVLPILLFWAHRTGGLASLKTKRPKAMIARGLVGFLAPLAFFSALKFVPLADAVVVFFAAPIIMTALSMPVLKERVGPQRWAAVLIGFVGVAIAMRATGEGAAPAEGQAEDGFAFFAVMMLLIGTTAYAVLSVMGRFLSDTESTFKLVFYFNLGVTLPSTVLAPFVWTPLTQEVFVGIVLIAVFALVGHLLMTGAFTAAPVSVVAPFEYTALIWAVLAGYLVWGDAPTAQVWLGAAIIIGCGLFISYRETRLRRR